MVFYFLPFLFTPRASDERTTIRRAMSAYKRPACDSSPHKVFKIRFAEPPTEDEDGPAFKHWNKLPTDVVEKVMLSSAISAEDAINMSLTCKSWKPSDTTLSRVVCRKHVNHYKQAHITCSQVMEGIVQTTSDEDGKLFILQHATTSGSIETLRKCYLCGYFFNSTDEHGRSILCNAIEAGRVDVLEFLIKECGAYVNLVDHFGESPLMFAAVNGSIECIRCLLDNGASIYTKAYDLATPLHLAVSENRIAVTELLLREGSPIEATDTDGVGAFHLAVRNGSIAMVRLLHKFGAIMDHSIDSTGYTPLHQAAFQGDIEIIEFMLEKGVSVDITTIDGKTILHTACMGCQFEMCDWIISKGNLDINKEDDHSLTTLDYAVQLHNFEIMTLLLENGADPFIGDTWLKISIGYGWSNLNISPTIFKNPFVKQLLLSNDNS